MVQTIKYSFDFILSSSPSGWLETVSEKTHHAWKIRNLTLLCLLSNCKVIDSAEGESRRDLFPSSVFSFCCPCFSVWDQLGRKDRHQGQILILVQQDNSYWRIMEQEGYIQGPRDGLWLHWIQMLLPQMFLSLPMGTNPRRCSCCLFGKSQSLTALISNQGSVGRLLSKGAWKTMKENLSTWQYLRGSALPLEVILSSPQK